jgi:multidrug efflux pump subunit AcrA (membrane-fusion protein)
VPTVQLKPHALAQTYAAEATIEAVRQATVAAQVQGRVLKPASMPAPAYARAMC